MAVTEFAAFRGETDMSVLCGWGWTEDFAIDRAKKLYVGGAWDLRRFCDALDAIFRHASPDGILRWAP